MYYIKCKTSQKVLCSNKRNERNITRSMQQQSSQKTTKAYFSSHCRHLFLHKGKDVRTIHGEKTDQNERHSVDTMHSMHDKRM